MTPTATFAAACGQTRPLRLAVEHAENGRIAEGELDQPFALIGSAAGCEIALNHPDVPERVACLQVIDGEAFVVALSGDAVHRLTPDSPLSIGPFTVRLLEPPGDGGATRIDHPLRDRATDRLHPRFRLAGLEDSAPHEIDRRLMFLGPPHDSLAYLTLTPDGLFVVDLLAGGPTLVNGEPVRVARLADGDELRIGGDAFTVTADRPTALSRRCEELLGGSEADDGDVVPLVTTPPHEIAPPATLDPDLAAVLQQVCVVQSQLIEQFQRTVDGMLADFGNLRREQLEALRDDMARMGEVMAQLARLRPPSGVTLLPPQPVGVTGGPMPVVDAAPVSEETAAVHQAVFERLAGLERERPGLWRRLRGLLGRKAE